MYDIIFPRSLRQLKDHVRLHRGIATLEEAQVRRFLSGDLVVFSGTTTIVPSDEWLWDWEKNDPGSYAHTAIRRL